MSCPSHRRTHHRRSLFSAKSSPSSSLQQTEADAAAYSVIANAKAEAEAVQIAALGEAEAIRVTAEAEAKAIAMRNEADRNVKDDQARAMQMARNEVSSQLLLSTRRSKPRRAPVVL